MKKFTRIELRFFGKDVPIKTYADYVTTAEKDVGRIIKAIFFSDAQVMKIASSKRMSMEKIATFLEIVNKEGLHYAREAFNENRNFYRTIEPILKEAGKTFNFSARWKRKVGEEIVGDFDIVSFFKREES